MPVLEVFFDYACPYCLRAHDLLEELMPGYPEIEIVWRPCEAHPRPDRYGPHSDLCIRGMYFAREQGVDLWAYHRRMYEAALGRRVNIEDAQVLSREVAGLLDPQAFLAMLEEETYTSELAQGNAYAYEQNGVWAVPAYRMEGRRLDAVENVGVCRDQLAAFLRG